MKKALIIGIDSTIGNALYEELLAAKWEVFGTTRRKKHIKKGIVYLDLLHFFEFRFDPFVDVVFLCASITKFSICRDYPEQCQKINLDAQISLSKYFLNKGSRIVFISTSAVFSGEKPEYKIDDVTCPVTEYGVSKALAEKQLQNISEEISIIRLTKVFTKNYPLIQQWVKQLKKNNVIEPFYDLYVCPIPMIIVVFCLKEIAEKKLRGIFHLSGETDISYQVVAENLATFLGKNFSLIKPKSAFSPDMFVEKSFFYTKLDMTESKNIFSLPNISLSTTLNSCIV